MFYSRKRKTSLFSMALLAILVSGCGGGRQSVASAEGVGHTSRAGQAVFTYFGQPKPLLTTSAGSVSVLGQAGATFTSVELEPPPNMDDTYLVFGRSVLNAIQLYRLPYLNGYPQLLYQNNDGALLPSISAYGTVAFDSTNLEMFTIRTDGTGLKPLAFTGVSTPVGASYSLDGTNRIAFWDKATHLYVAPGTGGTPTLIQSNEAQLGPVWNSGGTEIAYIGKVGSGGNSDIFITPANGGTPTDVTPTVLQNTGSFSTLSWNADGVTISSTYFGPGNPQIVKFNITNPALVTMLTPSGDYDQEPCFSPDGSQMVFYRDGDNGATPGIYIADAAGANQTLLLPDPSNNINSVFGGIAWSPFLPKETVIAASGSTFYHEAGSGFLLTQTGDQFGSLVAFTANTPSTAAIQAPASSAGAQPLLFTLTADSITEIGYTNSFFSPGTIVTLSSTPTVVVSIDANTGAIDLVAPAARAAATQAAGGYVTYNSKFTAIYDGTGKNLAPSGASQLVVNPKTGKLVSFK